MIELVPFSTIDVSIIFESKPNLGLPYSTAEDEPCTSARVMDHEEQPSEFFKKGAPTPKQIKTIRARKKIVDYELTSCEALNTLKAKVDKQKAKEDRLARLEKQAVSKTAKNSKKKSAEKSMNIKQVAKTKHTKKQKGQKATSVQTALNNICVHCQFSYGDEDNPLLDDEWVQCSVCKRWMHESCSAEMSTAANIRCSKCQNC